MAASWVHSGCRNVFCDLFQRSHFAASRSGALSPVLLSRLLAQIRGIYVPYMQGIYDVYERIRFTVSCRRHDDSPSSFHLTYLCYLWPGEISVVAIIMHFHPYPALFLRSLQFYFLPPLFAGLRGELSATNRGERECKGNKQNPAYEPQKMYHTPAKGNLNERPAKIAWRKWGVKMLGAPLPHCSNLKKHAPFVIAFIAFWNWLPKSFSNQPTHMIHLCIQWQPHNIYSIVKLCVQLYNIQ